MNHKTNIAFLGPEGSYSHIASKKYANTQKFSKIIEHSCQNFTEIIQLVTTKQVQYGILPIENSTSGSINEVYDLLQNTTLFVIGEIYIPIIHCILTIQNSSLEHIKTIYSHPEPFQQCSKFLNNYPEWKILFCKSSADAMQKISKLKNPHLAALGNEKSGRKLYGLQVIKKNLANKKNNTTRFIILGNEEIIIKKNQPTKITLKLSTENPPDIFIEKILLILQKYNITIHNIKIQTAKNNINKKIIFLDIIEDNLKNKHVQQALKKIQNNTISLKILGYYPISPIP